MVTPIVPLAPGKNGGEEIEGLIGFENEDVSKGRLLQHLEYGVGSLGIQDDPGERHDARGSDRIQRRIP